MMPKRVIDGEGLWRSDKIASIEPAWIRPEFANLVPLARANGSFECNMRLVYTQVYAYNRPEVTIEMVAQILAELQRVKLLFRWTDAGGKSWGYWIGINQPGRLPSPSRVDRKHEQLGAVPPTEALRKFLGMETTGEPLASHSVTNGEVGFGFGSGLGNGLGSSPDVDGESLTREIQNAWPYKDSSSGTERMIFEAIEAEIEDRKCSAKEASAYVRDRVLAIAKVIRSQWKPAEYRMLPLAKVMREKSYRNDDAVFENPHADNQKPMNTEPVVTLAERHRLSLEGA